jgi:hypothetical protein
MGSCAQSNCYCRSDGSATSLLSNARQDTSRYWEWCRSLRIRDLQNKTAVWESVCAIWCWSLPPALPHALSHMTRQSRGIVTYLFRPITINYQLSLNLILRLMSLTCMVFLRMRAMRKCWQPIISFEPLLYQRLGNGGRQMRESYSLIRWWSFGIATLQRGSIFGWLWRTIDSIGQYMYI